MEEGRKRVFFFVFCEVVCYVVKGGGVRLTKGEREREMRKAKKKQEKT